MRCCRPTRGPTLKPVLIVAHDGEFYRTCRTAAQAEKKPVRAGASPAGLEQQRHGGRRERGRRWATPAAVAAGSRRSATSTTRRTPAGTDVVVVRPARREGVSRKSTARVSPPATAAPSPVLLPGWLSGGLRSARSRCPTSSRSALARVQQTSAPPAAGNQGVQGRGRGSASSSVRPLRSRVVFLLIVGGTPVRARSPKIAGSAGVDFHGQGQGAPGHVEQLFVLLVVFLSECGVAPDFLG